MSRSCVPQASSSRDEQDGERTSEDEYQRHVRNSDDSVTTYSSSDGDMSLDTSLETDVEVSGGDLPLGEHVARLMHPPRGTGILKGGRMRDGEGGKQSERRTFTREHKHRPVEMSSKRPVSVLRDSTLGLGDGSGIMRRKRTRDPRFDSVSGRYSEKAFKKRFSFIFDEKIPEEQRDIKDSLSKIKSSSRKEKLQRKLQKLNQQLKTEEARRKQEARKQKVMDRHREAGRGKSNKFYLKKSEVKKQELLLQYEELKESGQLEKYMEKRRKKNAAKDHRYLPVSRN